MIRGALRVIAATGVAIMSFGQGLIGGVPTAHAGVPTELVWLWPFADPTDPDPADANPAPRMIGLNPNETDEDPEGNTAHVATASYPLSMVTAISNTMHQGIDPSGQLCNFAPPALPLPPGTPCVTGRGFVGLVFWNPGTSKFQWFGVVPSGAASGVDVNRGTSRLKVPAAEQAPPARAVAPAPPEYFRAGDVWATVQTPDAFGPLYVNFKGSNVFRYYLPVDLSFLGAQGVTVDQAAGYVYFTNEAPPASIHRLNPATNELKTWVVGGPGSTAQYLTVKSGKVYMTVSDLTLGVDAVVRLDPSTNRVVAWKVPGDENFCTISQCPTDPGTFQATPDGIDVDSAGQIWFVETQSNQVGRLDPAASLITEFTGLDVNGPQQIAAAGSGSSVQTFFTEGPGEAVSMVKPKNSQPEMVPTVLDTTCLEPVLPPALPPVPPPACVLIKGEMKPFDTVILPETANIPFEQATVPCQPGTCDAEVVRFAPMPAPPAERGGAPELTDPDPKKYPKCQPIAPCYPSGLSDVTGSMIVYGSYLDPQFRGNSAVFKAWEPAGEPAVVTPLINLPLPGWRSVTGVGAVNVVGSTKRAAFGIIIQRKSDGAPVTGRFSYYNPATGDRVTSTSISSVLVVGTTATIQGSCVNNGTPCTFTLIVQDNGSALADAVTITGDGLATAGGPLNTGNVTIQTKD
jgi:hypothetical protein